MALIAVISGCVALTAEAKKPVKPPSGPPTPDITPGMFIFNAETDSSDIAFGGQIDASGKILVCGLSGELMNSHSMATARLTADGLFDASFGDGGIATTSILYQAIARANILKPDGKLVTVGGARKLFGSSTIAMAGYTEDGSKDRTFGKAGIFTSDEYEAGMACINPEREWSLLAGRAAFSLCCDTRETGSSIAALVLGEPLKRSFPDSMDHSLVPLLFTTNLTISTVSSLRDMPRLLVLGIKVRCSAYTPTDYPILRLAKTEKS